MIAIRSHASVLTRLAFLALAMGALRPEPVTAQLAFGERRYEYQPADVLPGAMEFVKKDGHWEGYGPDPAGTRALLGYVFLSDNLVQIPGYSGHPLNTLVGIDSTGTITGVKIVRHSEPIVLIGLSEKVIHDFVAQYVGKNIRDRIIISDQPRVGYSSIDGISGATVTAIAENATILEAGRKVGRAVGIVQPYEVRTKRPSERFASATWGDLDKAGAVGHLVVPAADVGEQGDTPALEVRFAILDPPMIGRNLVGDRYYEAIRERLAADGGSAVYIGGTGKLSFKGAGFARGGIFDRFSFEQSKDIFVFKDVDYIALSELPIEGAPGFNEGGIFFLKNPQFDPAQAFTFHLTLPYRVQDRRAYGTFFASYELPRAFIEEERPFWMARWQDSAASTAAFALFVASAAAMFAFRWRLHAYRKLLHRSVAVIAAVWVGLVLKAQPSTTQILTPANSLVRGNLPFEIFLSEPLIFIFWITIGLSLLVWGRGFFCGWLCPYGAFLELLTSARRAILPARLREAVDAWDPGFAWRAGKYVTFLGILAVALVNLPLAEMLDEVEPFKTYILWLARPAHFVAYFVAVTLVSAVSYRFFCRFLCPLGGAMAITGRRPILPLLRWEQCATCKICYRGCEPRAISYHSGRIDYAECLQCWDCQDTAQDGDVCPEQIVAARQGRPPRLLVAVILALSATLLAASAGAAVRDVSHGPGAIGRAIAAGHDGDTLRLAPGVYSENVVLNKPLTLVGTEGAVVDGGGKGHVLVVTASGARIEGLVLRNSGSTAEIPEACIRVEKEAAGVELVRNRAENCLFGVWINGSEHAVLIGNRIVGKAELPANSRGNCVNLWSARHAVIRDNHLSHCRDGIYMDLSMDASVTGNTIDTSRYSVHTMWCDRGTFNDNVAANNLVGLALMFSKHLDVNRNVLHNNSTHGLLLTQVTRSKANDNVIVGNSKGLFLYNSLYNVVRGNFVARNNLALHYWGGSEENEVADNTFMDNEIQVKFVAGRDQIWPGNFWSDYVGWDMNGDGLGDVPYRSNTLVDSLLWRYPAAKLLLASPALQVLALAEREFPVITAPKGVDQAPRMEPPAADWESILHRYPAMPQSYYGTIAKLEHVPGDE